MLDWIRTGSIGSRFALVAASLAPFVVSLMLPALRGTNTASAGHAMELYGFELLLAGWVALFVGNLAWLANVAYLLALGSLLAGARASASGLASVAVLLALDTLRVIGVHLPADEAGVNVMVVRHLAPGFYVWIAALGVAAVSAALTVALRRGADGGPAATKGAATG